MTENTKSTPTRIHYTDTPIYQRKRQALRQAQTLLERLTRDAVNNRETIRSILSTIERLQTDMKKLEKG